MMDHADIRRIARDLGLSARTVEDLLQKGWTYHSKINEPAQWIGPTHG